MDSWQNLADRRVSEEFTRHDIFRQMNLCVLAYQTLANLVFGFATTARFFGNVDSLFFDSLAGTVDSVQTVLSNGKIADAYTLLRRFKETAHKQIHVMLLREDRDNLLQEVLNVDEIDTDNEQLLRVFEQMFRHDVSDELNSWLAGDGLLKSKAPSQSSSNTLKHVHSLFNRTHYKMIYDRCNDDVHINVLVSLQRNSRAKANLQLKWLDQFADDFRDLFIFHFAYIFSLHPEYMASSDYIDALELAQTPPEGSQNWVAPIVQDAFNEIVSRHRPDVTAHIQQSSCMELD